MLLALLASGAAQGDELSYQLGDLSVAVSGVLSSGATVRMEARDNRLLGKTDVPGQQNLCAGDDCMSLSGNPGPNQRLIDAVGSFSGVNGDNGNLNYDRYDLVAATTKLTPKLSLEYGDFSAKLRGIFFYDPVNTGFEETHSNTLYQPRHTQRPGSVSSRFARGFKWREALLTYAGERYTVTVGNQLVPWGEASLTQFNTLAAINPLDVPVVRMPGGQVNEYLRPVPSVTVSAELFDGASAELFYQLQSVRLLPDATGSYFSTSNILGGGHVLIVGLGQYVQDPNRQYQAPFPNSLVTSATRTAYFLPEHYGEPRDSGQFGAQFKYLAENINDGTELGLYYLHYHSRVPYLSTFAADASCTRQGTPGSFSSALLACRGFNGSLSPIGLEPLPVDTMRPFLDYPEDIDMLGLSFNTTLLHWSVAGEYAYRPNMPLQIAFSDLIFASESPAFPEQDIPIPSQALGQLAPFTIPGNRTAVPDFLSVYRNRAIEPNAFIRGYERFGLGQFALTGIRQFSSGENPFGADSMLVVLEVSGSNIYGLPSIDRLQFEGGGDRTHRSPGADGTGDPNGEANSLRINPTQQRKGFVTSFAWGYRSLIRLSYDNLPWGLNLAPAVLLFHDIEGVSPANAPNYLGGRKMAYGILESKLRQNLTLNLQYQLFAGGGNNNLLHDRDNLSMSLVYSF